VVHKSSGEVRTILISIGVLVTNVILKHTGIQIRQ
jgi:hypothetical protein